MGCSWVPSPALSTRRGSSRSRRAGAARRRPGGGRRRRPRPWPRASAAVSLRLSPLDTHEPLAEKLMTSADSRLAAASNEIRVRVESSKNRLTTVRPRSVGSFLISRCWVAAICSAVSSRCDGRRRGRGRRWTAGASRRHRPLAAVAGGSRRRAEDVDAVLPSVSRSRTATRSSAAVGRFCPTWSARIGSSRWPRSTSTASRTARGRPRSARASSAARIVRPEYRTSSTRTTTRSVTSTGTSVTASARVGCWRRSSRYIVTSREPAGGRDALDLLDGVGDAARPAGRRGWGCPAGRGRRRSCCARASRARCAGRHGRCRRR